MPNFYASTFNSFSLQGHVSTVQQLFQGVSVTSPDQAVIQGFLDSTQKLASVCKSDFQVNYLQTLQNVMKLAMTGSFAGMSAFTSPLETAPETLQHIMNTPRPSTSLAT